MTTQTGGNFFVLGLPRSRTAWLANFLSYGDRFCFHEGIDGCSSISEYRKKLKNHGDSGTGMMLFDMNELFPNAPILIIERDPKEAIDFCYKTYGYYDPKSIYYLKERLDTIKGMRVTYNDINERLQDIWEYLVGEGFNRQRADMLIKLDVQVINPYDVDQEAAKALFDEYGISET